MASNAIATAPSEIRFFTASKTIARTFLARTSCSISTARAKIDQWNTAFESRTPARRCTRRTETMQYLSTRGQAPRLGFAEAFLAGFALDGGSYLRVSGPDRGT